MFIYSKKPICTKKYLSVSSGSGPVTVIQQGFDPRYNFGKSHNVSVSGIHPIHSGDDNEGLGTILAIKGASVRFNDADSSVSVDCPEKKLPDVVGALAKLAGAGNEVRIVKLEKHPVEGQGNGRMKTLDKAISLKEVVEETKRHCGIKNLRLAVAKGKSLDCMVSTIAVCPGSGHSILANCRADVWVSGEMSHHEVLDAVHSGTSVILCEHSNSERGFLKEVRLQLAKLIGDDSVAISISERDRDPLLVV